VEIKFLAPGQKPGVFVLRYLGYTCFWRKGEGDTNLE
jgi:hypothetical protein